MKFDPPFTSIVAGLPHTVPFVGPEAQERNTGIEFRARLGANESSFGPSPLAIQAMREALEETWKYGDPENHDLRFELASHYGVSPQNIMVGEGIDGLLGNLCQMFVQPGRSVVSSLGSYPTFNFHVKSHGGELHLVPYADDHEDMEHLLSKAQETQATIIYLSNPNNPMGTCWSAHAVNEMIVQLPGQSILALDEAYIECADEGIAPEIDVTNPRVCRFRTFSKAYGMAGARIGYLIAHENIISAFDKVRNHYGVNRTGQVGALAALRDQGYMQAIREKIKAGRERIVNIALENGLQPVPSMTNFVSIDCGKGAEFADAIMGKLLQRGIFIRKPAIDPQSRCIRISVGLDHELDLFEEEFRAVLLEM